RLAIAGGLLLLLLGAAGAWFALGGSMPGGSGPDDSESLPLPPVPPRIAEGAEYERCLDTLVTDPNGAASLAESLQAAGGGDAAAHCLALARVALGEVEQGAEMLERIATASQAPGFARAAIFSQATEAW